MAEKSQLDMYIEAQDTLLKTHEGQIIAVRDGVCLGAYASKLDAYRDVKARGLQDGEYLIVHCTPGEAGYTSYFANWFAFGEAPAHG